jgi:hypothetical protein
MTKMVVSLESVDVSSVVNSQGTDENINKINVVPHTLKNNTGVCVFIPLLLIFSVMVSYNLTYLKQNDIFSCGMQLYLKW